ncbi:hypothetical protein [Brachybacterium phenoliresistens]|uniref:Integrase n=1 Tax=Brachybacterium phenoliresistens TaxID=396014 RepID=Z9JYA5_9MICO|nr:hypothetical protein [Brachybacterium phenoliresistens]EWS82978.1 hypothetical protein BF93_06570 [Brachybacterium phenoliresistens]
MRITTLTDPAAPDRTNEDAVALGPDLAVVVDGAGLDKAMRRGCSHSVSWYSRTLAHEFALRLAEGPEEHDEDAPAASPGAVPAAGGGAVPAAVEVGVPAAAEGGGPEAAGRRLGMREALGGAIAAVRDRHARTCDLAAGSPSGTVAAWRVRDRTLETLVLCDAAIIVARTDAEGSVARADLTTDLRVHDAVAAKRRELAAREEAAPVGSAAREEIPLRFRALDAARNVEDGFWCAHHDPAAAEHAIVQQLPWSDELCVIAASDGAVRAILELGTHTVEEFADACAHGGEDVLASDIRAEEDRQLDRYRARGAKVHDDLTLAIGRP